MEMAKEYKDIEKYDKDMDMVDPGSDSMPDLHGKHVGREALAGSKGKETIMIDDNAKLHCGLNNQKLVIANPHPRICLQPDLLKIGLS